MTVGLVKSAWSDVLSGVPQGSVLGPLLFVIYINDLPEAVNSNVKLFADDSKLLSIINEPKDSLNLQKDLDAICEWTRLWGMRLNVEKCKTVHFGRKNLREDYFMSDSSGSKIALGSSKLERDLGVTVSDDLKWEGHISTIVNKANRLLGLLKRTFICRDPGLWRNLYMSLVRPHLEYAVQVWNPYLEGDIKKIEKVQERATKIPYGFSELSYEERLRRMNLTTLNDRRIRGDLIEMYKVVNEQEQIEWVNFPKLRSNLEITGPAMGVRGNSRRIRRESFKSKFRNNFAHSVTVRHNFFLNRTAPIWNELPEILVSSSSLNSFKSSLDKHFERYGCFSL